MIIAIVILSIFLGAFALSTIIVSLKKNAEAAQYKEWYKEEEKLKENALVKVDKISTGKLFIRNFVDISIRFDGDSTLYWWDKKLGHPSENRSSIGNIPENEIDSEIKHVKAFYPRDKIVITLHPFTLTTKEPRI